MYRLLVEELTTEGTLSSEFSSLFSDMCASGLGSGNLPEERCAAFPLAVPVPSIYSIVNVQLRAWGCLKLSVLACSSTAPCFRSCSGFWFGTSAAT